VPSPQLPYAQHLMPQFQHMPQLQQMQYMQLMQEADAWSLPHHQNPRMHMLTQDEMDRMHQEDEASDDSGTETGSEHSARMSEINRSLAGMSCDDSGHQSSSSDSSMASDEGSIESGASLEP
jgi:hypothetical protein